ncbi:calcium-binding protein, partial [uncultured Campylobacter sp.]|uniref:calcium-binding protein n=1 Tax=uncultured Campylobacter sp. TaxID=218934 RepID=UPI00262070CE
MKENENIVEYDLPLKGDYALDVLSYYIWGKSADKKPKNDEIVDEKYANRKYDNTSIQLNVKVSEFMNTYFKIYNADMFMKHINIATIPMFNLFFECKNKFGNKIDFKDFIAKNPSKVENGKLNLDHKDFVELFYSYSGKKDLKKDQIKESAQKPNLDFSMYKQDPDKVEDFAQAAFVFGSSKFSFDTRIKEDGIKYIFDINDDGTITPNRIENLKLTLADDNFDFKSDSLIASMINPTLRKISDPNDIGKTVKLHFINDFYGEGNTGATITAKEFGRLKNIESKSLDLSRSKMINMWDKFAKAYFEYFEKIYESNVINYSAEGKYVIYGDKLDNWNIRDTVTKLAVDLKHNVKIDDALKLCVSKFFEIIEILNITQSLAITQEELIARAQKLPLLEKLNNNLNPHKDRLSNGIIYLLGGGADTATGTDKDDILIGGDGSDTLYGDKGDDIIFAGNRSKDKSKDNGSDISPNTLYGGAGNDRLYGSSGDDTIYADTNKDYIFVEDQDELAANFDDTNTTNYLYGNSGSDTLIGSRGTDYLYADSEEFKDKATDTNTLVGKEGDDHIFGGNGINNIFGGSGNDTISAKGVINNIYTHSDSINGMDQDYAKGASNTVTINRENSVNKIYGGRGKDVVTIEQSKQNTLNLGDGDNIINITSASINNISTGAGKDTITVNGGVNVLNLGDGENTVNLTSQNDNLNYINTGKDRDQITVSGNSHNTIYAGKGKDIVRSGSGNDTINAGDDDDADELYGGEGYDTYSVNTNDIIKDDDGKGKIYFHRTHHLSGGVETEAGSKIYKGDNFTYNLNDKTLTVTDDLPFSKGSITINNYNKYENDGGDLEIKLVDKIDISIDDVTVEEGDTKNQIAKVNVSLSRKLKENETITLYMPNGDTLEFKAEDQDKTYEYKYDGDYLVNLQKERKITIAPWKTDSSPNISASVKKIGHITITDDDTPVYISTKGSTVAEIAEKIQGTIFLNRGLKKGERITAYANGKKIKITESGQKFIAATWEDDKKEEEDSKFYGGLYNVSSNATVYVNEKSGKFVIKDDDKDKKPGDPKYYDPLVVDLGGDGIELIKMNGAINFDHDLNGFAEATGWIGKNEAFLALDKNGNGVIDNASELFGDGSSMNGFEELKKYDSNKDGTIDEKDEIWSKLLLWQDKNSDAISSKDELSNIKDSQIKSIDLNYENKNLQNAENIIKEVSKVTFKDGKTAEIADVNFKVDPSDSRAPNVEIATEILNLPNVSAMGNMYDLHSAMSLNAALKSALQNYISLSPKDRKAAIKSLIYKWAGVENNPTSGRGAMSDARELNVYEALSGEEFVHVYQGRHPNSTVSRYLHELYQRFEDYVYAQIELQTTYKNVLDTEYMVLDNETQKLDYDFSAFKNKMKELYADKKYEEMVNLKKLAKDASAYKPNLALALSKNLTALGVENPAIYEVLADKILKGDDGENSISGTSQNDYIDAGGGNDKVYAGIGDDVLIGGEGGDYLEGGAGDDTYIYNLGDGADTILDGGGSDTIKFGAGISKDDIVVRRTGDDIRISFKNSQTDSILLRYNASNASYYVENFLFDNGETMGMQDILDLSLIGTDSDDVIYGYNADDTLRGGKGNDTLNGGEGNDILYGGDGDDKLYGGNGNDTLYGSEGNDALYGSDGNDILEGGSGNDYLEGGSHNDTYIFGRGDGADTIYDGQGNDTIKFKEGITVNDLLVKRADNNIDNLEISIKGTDDKLTLNKVYYWNGTVYGSGIIENFEFADGTKLSLSELEKQTMFKGTDGNDTIYGANAKDEIHGGTGNDTIYGQDADDALYGEAGNDTLNGGEGNDILYGGD